MTGFDSGLRISLRGRKTLLARDLADASPEGPASNRRAGSTPFREGDLVMARHQRSGFTLIELLVAIAIIATLVAIAAPAVQRIRQAAQRTQCQNHLRQMGVALAGFESTWGALPAGRDARNGWHHSWATAILPHLEQSALYDQYDYQRVWDDVANEPVIAENLTVFRCPAALAEWPGKSDYGGNCGSALTGLTPGFQCGFAWEAGMLPPIHVELPGNYRQAGVRMGEVRDGASQTFLVLEDADRAAEEGGLWGNGYNCFAHDEGPVNANPSKEIFSRHPGGAHALLADGSVPFLSESADLSIIGAMCTRARGEVVGQ